MEKKLSWRQRILQKLYPAIMGLQKSSAAAKVKKATGKETPPQSFYRLSARLNNGDSLPFDNLRGKKILLVNTASDCGYTAQYKQLQQLQEEYKTELIVIGFPANDFKEQERGGDEAIAHFCAINFGVQFPLAKKSSVVKGAGQNEVFRWLSDADLNGWNSKAPEWNFSKYLVNEDGLLTHYFPPAVSPLSDVVKNAINNTE